MGSVLGRPRNEPLRLRQLPSRARGAARAAREVAVLVWRASPALTAALAVATVLAGLVPAASVAVARMVIDAVVRAVSHPPASPSVGRHILLLVGLQFLVAAGNAVVNAIRGVAERLLGERVTLAVQIDVMEHAGRLDLPFFENSASYDLLRQAQQEAASRPMSTISLAFAQIQGTVTLVSLSALLFGLSPVLVLAALLGPIPVFLSDTRFGNRMFQFALWASPTRRRMQYLSGLVTTDTAAKEVKLFGLDRHFVTAYRTAGEELYRRMRKLVTTRSAHLAGWGLVGTAVSSLALLYAAREALAGRMTVGDLVLCSTALLGVHAAVQGLLLGLSAMYQDSRYLALLRDFLAVPTETDRGGRELEPGGPGHVVFERVSFTYPGAAEPALRDVSLDIPPGRMLAVVGRNGAGKSTLIKLLCGLYRPSSGRILIDGQDIRELRPDSLRAAIGAMFQDYVRYQATVAENIGFGDVTRLADRDRIADSARKAGAVGLVDSLPKGYDTQLGRWFDDGVEVSGGEWQKLALSRAFLRDAPLLVLDEPTAALDAEAEFQLFDRLRRLASGRTTVYISHRFSTVRRADRVVLIEDGRVVEYGTHVELMALDGAYAVLFRLQAHAYLDGPGDGAVARSNGAAAGRTDNIVR
jgi:ATP-binding cassette subfamily B protein